MMVFVHVAICPLVSDVHSAAVACGMGDRLGNKGGVGLSVKVADTRFVFVNAHLAAHQHDVAGRNAQVAKLYVELPYLLMKNSSSSDWTAVEGEEEEVDGGSEKGECAPAPFLGEAGIYDNHENHVDSDDDEEVIYRDWRKSVRGSAVSSKGLGGRGGGLGMGGMSTSIRGNSMRGSSIRGSSFRMTDRTAQGALTPSLVEYADRLVFMGDLNYRVNGNR